MKKTFFLLISVLAASLTGCRKDMDSAVASEQLSITVNSENSDDKTTLNRAEVYWDSRDVLTVFNQDEADKGNYKAYNFITTGSGASVTFVPQSPISSITPIYASSSPANATSGAACTTAGVFVVNLSAYPKLGDFNTYAYNSSASVGKVTAAPGGGYQVTSMKNVMGLVRFAITRNDVAKVEVEAVDGKYIAGYVNVNYDYLEKGIPFWTSTKSSKTKIEITPDAKGKVTDNGCIRPGTYLVSLLPDNYSQGLKFTFKNAAGTTLLTRTVGGTKGVNVVRGQIVSVEEPLDVKAILPDVVTMDLDFTAGNPFGFSGAPSIQDETAGETYSVKYSYTYGGQSKDAYFPFILCKGKTEGAQYKYRQTMSTVCTGQYVLEIAKNNAWLKLPVVPGRHLQSVTLSHCNTWAKQWKVSLSSDASDAVLSAKSQAATGGQPNVQTVEFNTSTVSHRPEMGTSYYLVFNSAASMNILDIKLVYQKDYTGGDTGTATLGFSAAVSGNAMRREHVEVTCSGASASSQLTINWGDGQEQTMASGQNGSHDHQYSKEGTYTISAKCGTSTKNWTLTVHPLDALSEIIPELEGTNKVWVMTHRAHTTDHTIPENSISAVNAAIAAGADFLETDTKVTSDNNIIMAHDDDVSIGTNGTGYYSQKTLTQVKQLRLKDRDGNVTTQQVPTLEEYLLAARGKAYVDLDFYTTPVDDIMAIVEKLGMKQQVILYCQKAEQVAQLHTYKAMAYGYATLYKEIAAGPYKYFVQWTWKTTQASAAQYYYDYCLCSVNLLSVLDSNIPLYSIDQSQVETILTNFPRLHMIQTDCPAELISVLESKGRR